MPKTREVMSDIGYPENFRIKTNDDPELIILIADKPEIIKEVILSEEPEKPARKPRKPRKKADVNED